MKPKLPLTVKSVETIESLSGYGLSMEKIAQVLGMSKKTLERRIKDTPPELGARDAMERGRAKAESKVAQVAWQMAISGKRSEMTKYWLNCRARWKPTTVVENTGKDGAPLEMAGPQIIVTIPSNGREVE